MESLAIESGGVFAHPALGTATATSTSPNVARTSSLGALIRRQGTDTG